MFFPFAHNGRRTLQLQIQGALFGDHMQARISEILRTGTKREGRRALRISMTDESLQWIRYKMRTKIEERGWAIMSVFPGETTPAYSYTVGLTSMSLPEVLIMGPGPEVSSQLLDACVAALLSGEVHVGQHSPVPMTTTTIPFALRLDDEERTMAGLMLPGPYLEQQFKRSAIQLVVPDAAGLFPWQDGCDQRYIASQDPNVLKTQDTPAPARQRPPIH